MGYVKKTISQEGKGENEVGARHIETTTSEDMLTATSLVAMTAMIK